MAWWLLLPDLNANLDNLQYDAFELAKKEDQKKSLGSNDAEVQSVLEAEDQTFRVRLLWAELHGVGATKKDPRKDLAEQAEHRALQVPGIQCADSKCGFNAMEVNESPLLGLSNMRAALQAFQLRDNLARVGCSLRWLASDYDLADAMTKKKADSRSSLLRCLTTSAYDPQFIPAKKNKKAGKSAIERMDEPLGDTSDEHALHQLALAINAGLHLPAAAHLDGHLHNDLAISARDCRGLDTLTGTKTKT